MSITVRDLLKIDMLQNARLLAGKDGLEQLVGRVNFTDCPIKFDDEEYALARKGDLFICSLYLAKDDESKIYDFFHFYIITESCCCILTDAYLTENQLPQRVIDLANRNKYPILMIPDEIEYGELIRELSEMLILDRMDAVAENRLNQLLYENLPVSELICLAKYLNRAFLRCYTICYFEAPNLKARQLKMLFGLLKASDGLRPLSYQNGGFIILNYNDCHGLDALIQAVSRTLKSYEISVLGVSSEFTRIDSFDDCLRQAVSAYEMSAISGEQMVYYSELSLYNILYPIREQSYLREFCKKIMDPLHEYGQQQGIDLIGTIGVYLQNNGDFKKTAVLLHTHENTVRFRISKAKSILHMENSHFQFVEQLSIALKADKLAGLKK